MMNRTGPTANKDPNDSLLEVNAYPDSGKVSPRYFTSSNRSQLKMPPPQWKNQNDFNDTNNQRKNLKKPPPPPPPSLLSLYPERKDPPSDHKATATPITDGDTKSLSDSNTSFLDKNDSFGRANGNIIVGRLDNSNNSTGQRRRDLVPQAQHSSTTRILSGGKSGNHSPEPPMDDGSYSVYHLLLAEEDDAADYGHSSLRRGAEPSSSRRKQSYHNSYTDGLGPSYLSDSRGVTSQPRRHRSKTGAPPRRHYSHEGVDRQVRPPPTSHRRRSYHHDQSPKAYRPRRYHEGPSDRSDRQEQDRYYEQEDSLYNSARDPRDYYHGPSRLVGRSRRGGHGGYDMTKSESCLNYSHSPIRDSSRHGRGKSADDYFSGGQNYPLLGEDEHHYYHGGRECASYQDLYCSDRRDFGYRNEQPREPDRRHGRALVGTNQRNCRSMSALMVPNQDESHNRSARALNSRKPKPAVRPGAFPMVGRGKREIPQECLRRASFEQDDSRRSSSHSEKKAASTSIVNSKGKDKDDIYVEVAPGVEKKVRLVRETTNAIKTNFYTKAVCWGCATDLYCVSDASFLICPTCTVVSPVEDSVPGSHGVGIACTKEMLIKIKEDARSEAHASS